jgi:hypothetical protein
MLYSVPRLGSLSLELKLVDFRTAAIGLTAAAFIASGTAAHAQTMVASTAAPSAPLAKHCDDIKDVFELAKFSGEYRLRADAFTKSGCAGDVPLPKNGDSYNIRRFNTSAGILQNGGGIVIAPN